MVIYDCFRNSIHVNTDVPKPHARLCFKHMLFHMMLMHRYFLPRTHKPLVDEWLGGLVCRFVRSFMFRPRFRCLYLLPLELPSHIYIYIYKHTCYLIYIYLCIYIYFFWGSFKPPPKDPFLPPRTAFRLFGFSEMIALRGWIQWWSEWYSLLNGHAGGCLPDQKNLP